MLVLTRKVGDTIILDGDIGITVMDIQGYWGHPLIEEMSKVGAHAILEYHTYQDSAMLRKNEVTGEMLNVYRMNIEAKLIRYTD